MGRVNLCKVDSGLRERLAAVKGDQSWPDFIEDVAQHYERGVDVKIDHYGGRTETRNLNIGESTEVVTDLVIVSVDTGDHGYECDDCERTLPLRQIIVNGDRTVCIECSTPEDRIIQ